MCSTKETSLGMAISSPIHLYMLAWMLSIAKLLLLEKIRIFNKTLEAKKISYSD